MKKVVFEYYKITNWWGDTVEKLLTPEDVINYLEDMENTSSVTNVKHFTIITNSRGMLSEEVKNYSIEEFINKGK